MFVVVFCLFKGTFRFKEEGHGRLFEQPGGDNVRALLLLWAGSALGLFSASAPSQKIPQNKTHVPFREKTAVLLRAVGGLQFHQPLPTFFHPFLWHRISKKDALFLFFLCSASPCQASPASIRLNKKRHDPAKEKQTAV